MQTLQTTSLRVSENQLFILDQQALPQEKRWLAADNVALLVDHIHTLRVRGAPLIRFSAITRACSRPSCSSASEYGRPPHSEPCCPKAPRCLR